MIDLDKIKKDILNKYIDPTNNYPWIVAYSGGKDSNLLLQIIFDSIIDKCKLKRKIIILNSDTLIENPLVTYRINLIKNLFLEWVNKNNYQDLFTFKIVKPIVKDSFWVSLIGKGYASPNQNFRWCTSRLKITPMEKEIETLRNQNKNIISILGTRNEEGSGRAKLMNKYSKSENKLYYHPIKNFKIIEVWKYLMINKPLWDNQNKVNKNLNDLYQESSLSNMETCSFNEASPKVFCGKSRWGCWTCTLVDQDKSIDGFIWNGRDWLKPYANFRKQLLLERDLRENRYSSVIRIMKDDKVVLQKVSLMKVKKNKKHYYLPRKQLRPKLIINLETETIGNDKFILYNSLDEYKRFTYYYHDYPQWEFVLINKELYTTSFRTYTLLYRKKLLNRLLDLEREVNKKLISEEEIKQIKHYWKIVKNKIESSRSSFLKNVL